VKTLEDLAPVIELYHHMVRGGIWMRHVIIYDRLQNAFNYQFGAYQLQMNFCALYLDVKRSARLKKDDDQAWTLNGLANATVKRTAAPRRSAV